MISENDQQSFIATNQTAQHNASNQQGYNAFFYQNTYNQLNKTIKSRIRWLKVSKVLEIITHIFQGSSTIFVFLSAATNVSELGIVAGCLGISSAALLVYSQYCKRNYEDCITKMKKLCDQVNIDNKLNYMPQEITPINNLTKNLQNKLENAEVIFNTRTITLDTDYTMRALQDKCSLLINQDIKNELNKNITASEKWRKLYKYLEVLGYIFQSSTGILAFIGFAINLKALSILSGCMGVSSCMLLFYSQNCKQYYENSIKVVESIFEQIELQQNADAINQQRVNYNNIELSNREDRLANYDCQNNARSMLVHYNNRNIRETPPVTPMINEENPANNNISNPIYYY